MKIQESWVRWAEGQVTMLKDGGHMVFPSDGAIFQINKKNHTLVLVCARPSWIGSETDKTNQAVFARVGYRVVTPPNVPTTPEQAIDRIVSQSGVTVFNPDLVGNLGAAFNMPSNKLDAMLQAALKKAQGLKREGINPVTIRGDDGSERLPMKPGKWAFTVGRLWVQSGGGHVKDTAHRFNPAERREDWEKTMTFVIWDENHPPDANKPEGVGVMVIDDEADYLKVCRILQADDKGEARLVGVCRRGANEEQDYRLLMLRRQDDKLFASIFHGPEFTKNPPVAFVAVDYDRFARGMGHLFPKGELD